MPVAKKRTLRLPKLTLAELRRSFPAATVLSFATGEEIIAENSGADSLFFLIRGHVQVYRKLHNGGRLQLARLGEGSIVGEVALLTDGRRSANVKAVTAVRLMEIKAADFALILQGDNPVGSHIALHLSRHLAERLHNMLDLVVREAEKRPALVHRKPIEVPQVLRSLYANVAV